MKLRTYFVVATYGLLLSASCGKDSDGTKSAQTDKAKTEKAAPVENGVPAAVAGEYELAKTRRWRMLEAKVYVAVGPDWAKVGKVVDGATTNAESVELEELASKVAALLPKPPAQEPAEPAAPTKEDQEEELGGTGTKMSLDEGKMGKRDSDRSAGRYSLENEGVDPARARREARKKAIEAGVLAASDDVPVAALLGTGDFSSGLDDRSLYGGSVGPAYMGPLPSPGWISKQAPLLIADKDLKVARVVEVLRSLCRGGALLGVAREGSTVATQHTVVMGTLQSESCPGPAADKNGFLRPPGATNRAVLAMAETGYEFQGKEVEAKGEKTDLAELTQALVRQLDERKGKPIELWLLVDETTTVGELVTALDAAAAAKVAVVYVAMTSVQFKEGHRPPVPADNKAEPPAGTAALDKQIVEYWLGDSGMQGGFGFGAEGIGPGADGTGWGTIGPGRYANTDPSDGTGKVYGTGHGRGGMHGRKGVEPQLRLGNLSTAGDLDKNIIHRYLRRKLPRIKYCYEKELSAEPGLKGTVVANFQIGPSGAVVGSAAKGVNAKVSSCVADVIKSIQFPKPRGGGIVQVRYPLSFMPSGG